MDQSTKRSAEGDLAESGAMDILGIADVLDGSGEDTRAVQDMAALLAQQLGSEPTPRPAAPTPPIRNTASPKVMETQMRDKVGRLRQLLGRLIEMATQKDEKFGQVMRELVKKLLDGNMSDSKFITEIDRIGGIRLQSQAANFPHFLSSTLPYLRFQLQQETQAIFQQKAKRATPSIKTEPASTSPAPPTTMTQAAIPAAAPTTAATPSATPAAAAISASTNSVTAAAAGVTTTSSTRVTPAVAAAAAAAASATATGSSPNTPTPLVNPNALRALLQAAGQQKMMEALKNPQLYHMFMQRHAQQASLAAKGQQRPTAATTTATAAPTVPPQVSSISATTATANLAPAVLKTPAPPSVVASTASASVPTPTTAVAVPSHPQPVATSSAPTASSTTTPSKPSATSKAAKSKTKDDAPGEDDNDVTLVGGVNLREETAILTGAEHAPLQTQTCGDQTLLAADPLRQLIAKKVKECGLESASPEVTQLMSHAMEARLRDTLEKLTVINQHRAEHYKEDSQVEITTQARGQLRFLEEVDRHNTKKRQEQQREMLLKAAKSRARPDDPEAALLKEKARQVQHEEDELMRKNAANLAALAAIGPRRKRKADEELTASTEAASGAPGVAASQPYASQLRTRQRRIGLKDYLFYLEQEKTKRHSKELFKAYMKQT
eukprot:scpid44312/ scgid19952/ Transcription initiation factor TFIID subunit 4; 110 kDa TBP-associated factor; Transcription initiation factor TFIID 110 kDa subunit